MPFGIRSNLGYQFQINSLPLNIAVWRQTKFCKNWHRGLLLYFHVISVVNLKPKLYMISKFFLLSLSGSATYFYELAVKKEAKTLWKDWLLSFTICIFIYICNNKIKKLALLNAIIQKEIALKNYFPCAWNKLKVTTESQTLKLSASTTFELFFILNIPLISMKFQSLKNWLIKSFRITKTNM